MVVIKGDHAWVRTGLLGGLTSVKGRITADMVDLPPPFPESPGESTNPVVVGDYCACITFGIPLMFF